MIFVIRPPVWRSAAKSIIAGWGKAATFFLAASLGSILVASTAVAVGRWIGFPAGHWPRVALASIGLVLVASDLGVIRAKLPCRSHQVARGTILRHPWLGAIPYGFALGTGVWTYVQVALPYFLFVVLLLLPEPRAGLVAGIAFAAGRALPLFIAAFFRDVEEGSLDAWIDRTLEPISRLASAGLIVAVGVRLLDS